MSVKGVILTYFLLACFKASDSSSFFASSRNFLMLSFISLFLFSSCFRLSKNSPRKPFRPPPRSADRYLTCRGGEPGVWVEQTPNNIQLISLDCWLCTIFLDLTILFGYTCSYMRGTWKKPTYPEDIWSVVKPQVRGGGWHQTSSSADLEKPRQTKL